MAMKVWVVECEHPTVPGRVVKVCGSSKRANDEALALVKTMPAPYGGQARSDNWQRVMDKVQNTFGAQYACVEITENDVLV